LKIVYWSSVNEVRGSVFQEKLAEQIGLFQKKQDFSAFDIYQHVPDGKKKIHIDSFRKNMEDIDLSDFANLLKNTKKQLLVFSGNLSWINVRNKKADPFKLVEHLVKKNIPVKIVSRVDFNGWKNIQKLMSLNFKYGKELIEIRHKAQPLRAFISDDKIARIKEVKEPSGKGGELRERIYIHYTIKDKEWVTWLSKVFWNLFSKSIDSEKRMAQMEILQQNSNLYK